MKEPVNDLQRLIADSIETRNARIAALKAEQEAEQARLDALYQSLLAEAVELVKPGIPSPLHSYIRHTGGRPGAFALEARTWRPAALHIDAPGLAVIEIEVADDDDGVYQVWTITVAGASFALDEWSDAIAAASDHYRNNRAEYSKAALALG